MRMPITRRLVPVLMLFALAAPLAVPSTVDAAIGITIYIGRTGCSPGMGICRIVIDLRQSDRPAGPSKESAEASATIQDGKLRLDLSRPMPGKGDAIPVDEDITLDPRTAKALGFESVTVLKGEYQIDRRASKFGTLELAVRTTASRSE
jgi:hypothetical protein